MDDIGQTIQDILGDPQKMAELRTIAESLGLNTTPQESDAVSTQEEPAAAQTAKLSSSEPRQEALLQALLPYLSPSRRNRLERALRVARLSKLAGAALQNYGTLFEAGVL